MRIYSSVIALFLLFLIYSCSPQTNIETKAELENSSNKSQAESNPSSDYAEIEKITWDVTDVCSIEATLLNSRLASINLPKDTPKHIFTIRETHTGKTLLKEQGSESAMSMEMVKLDRGENFLFVSYATGAAELARGYLVKCDSSKGVFDEAYRDFFWHLYAWEREKDKSRFLIFTADNLTEFNNALMIEQWEWTGSTFKSNGVYRYDEFIKDLNQYYKNNNKPFK